MPTGNHHYTPSGFWYETPQGTTLPKLLFKTVRSVTLMTLIFSSLTAYKALQPTHTYTAFIGKTITHGKSSLMTGEPAPVEVIDRLKAEEAARKKHNR